MLPNLPPNHHRSAQLPSPLSSYHTRKARLQSEEAETRIVTRSVKVHIEEAGENEMKETEDDHLPGFNVLTIKSPSSFPDGINFIVFMLRA